MPSPLSPQEKLDLIKKVTNEGVSVANACKEFGVSRFTFYKWYNRYKDADSHQKTQALKCKRPSGEDHWKTTAPQEENRIIELVIKYPEYSVHQLVKLLPTLGNTAIQKVLEKNGLNTGKKRIVFSQQVKKGSLAYHLSWSTKLNFFFGSLPPIVNNRITRFFF
ncbi:transposase, partial [Patescibacteria group bacterium]|nr:transposase [Patescibacteria group bacterium]